MSLYDALVELYNKYGYFKETLVSFELKGKEGAEKIAQCIDSLRNEELEEEFTELLQVRESVSKAIEPLRSGEEKIIGSSLEARVEIVTKNPELLNKYSDILADFFIVSQAECVSEFSDGALNTLDVENCKIAIFKAKGEKCQRCWKYRELNENGICEDCAEAIK